MPMQKAETEADCRPRAPEAAQALVTTLPPDFWLNGPPPGLLWQTVASGALRIAYARPLPEMLS